MAPSPKDTATPVSGRRTGSLAPRPARRRTSPVPANAPIKAMKVSRWAGRAPDPMSTATAASPPPEVIPTVSGAAKGLRSADCNRQPETAMAIPAQIPTKIRGARYFQMSGSPVTKAVITSPGGFITAPTPMPMIALNANARMSPTSTPTNLLCRMLPPPQRMDGPQH